MHFLTEGERDFAWESPQLEHVQWDFITQFIENPILGILPSCLDQVFISVGPGRKLNVHKTSEDLLDVFWTPYVRSIYVLCLRGRNE